MQENIGGASATTGKIVFPSPIFLLRKSEECRKVEAIQMGKCQASP
jgi:hypothetical protein